VIVADYQLAGGATGIEAIAAIRVMLGRAVPAVLVTGATSPDALGAARAGGVPPLHKPPAPAQLRAAPTQPGRPQQPCLESRHALPFFRRAVRLCSFAAPDATRHARCSPGTGAMANYERLSGLDECFLGFETANSAMHVAVTYLVLTNH